MVTLTNLFELIQKNGLTKSKVAKDTKISSGNISDWESGRSMPSATKLDVLADYFGCSVDYLLGRTNGPNSITNGDISNSSVAQANGDNNQISIQSNNENPYAEIIEHLGILSDGERRHAIADLMDVLESKYPVKKK